MVKKGRSVNQEISDLSRQVNEVRSQRETCNIHRKSTSILPVKHGAVFALSIL